MTELAEHPAEPAEKGITTYGGFAEIARRLNALHPEREKPISRQLVQRWYLCRGSNGMPDRKSVEVEGKEKVLFNIYDVERWHTRRELLRREKGQPIETIPLFMVDDRGVMIV